MRNALALALLLAACSPSGSSTAKEPSPKPAATAQAGSSRNASVDDLAAKLGQVPLIDVRTPGEYGSGHVAGAQSIPLNELGGRIAELDAYKGEEVWVICQVGGRSASAAQMLTDKGFKTVNVLGGTAAWRASGKPVE